MHDNTGVHREWLEAALQKEADRMSESRHEKWGVFDTVDKVWIGNDAGPRVFSNDDPVLTTLGAQEMAKIAAQIFGVQLGLEPGRLREMPYTTAGKLRDSVDTKMDTATAIKRIEEGGAL